MRPEKETKEKILEAAAELILHKGFHHTGIQEILKKAGIPKGSFYFHFKSKEDLGLQLIDYFLRIRSPRMMELLSQTDKSPLERMQMLFHRFLTEFENNDFVGGCPIGNLCQEMGDLSETFNDKLKVTLTGFKEVFRQFILQAKEEKQISADIDPERISDFIVSGWEGAIMQAKVMRNAGPLLNFQDILFGMILV